MATDDFIMRTLNLTHDQIQSLSTAVIRGNLIIHIQLTALKTTACPFCGGPVKTKGYSHHEYNHLDIAGTPSRIDWKRRRYVCKDCSRSFSEENPFGPEKFRQSYAVLSSVAKDLKNIHYSFQDITQKHHISTTIVQLYADSFLHVPRQPLSENLGIDELHSKMARYGGSYLCTITDNHNRVLLEILPDRSKRTLSRYFEQIPASERKKVKYVTIDLWEPYKDVAEKYFKGCHVAADPFHVVKNLTDGFSRIRIDIMNQCVKDSPEYYLLKKWHKLLEDDRDLDNKPKYNSYFRQKMNYRDLYDMLLALNADLTRAYQLKEKYRRFNKNCSFENAPHELDELIDDFESADLYCYKDFTGLLRNWRQEIIYSFERPDQNRKQSNSLTEGLNQKLRELLTIANGFANFDRFRARAIYCLNDRVFFSLTQSLNSCKREGKKRGPYIKDRPILEEDPDNSIDSMSDDSDFQD